MALVVVPDIEAQPGPLRATIHAAERAFVAALGGIAGVERLPGALDGANVSAEAGFARGQTAEPNARVALSFRERAAPDAPDPAMAPSASGVLLVPRRMSADTLSLYTNGNIVWGKVLVRLNGAELASIDIPFSAWMTYMEVREFPFPYTLAAGDVLELAWRSGADLLRWHANGEEIRPGVRVFATLYGIASHGTP